MTKKTKPCTLYLVRHGETEWNVRGIMQGHKDSPLTENGINQARDLGTELSDIHFDFAFASDLLRAKRTAEIITLERKLAVQTTKLLRERAFGKAEGMEYQKAREIFKDLFSAYDSIDYESRFRIKPYPDIESDEEMIGRVITFIRELSISHPGQTGLIVTHGGTLRSFLMHLGWATPKELPSGAIGNTAYVILETDGVEMKVIRTKNIKRIKNG